MTGLRIEQGPESTRKKTLAIVVVIALIAVVVGLLLLRQGATPTTYGHDVGDVPPDFTLPDTDNVPWNLEAHVGNGKPTLLEFIHPGVPACQSIADDLESMNTDYQGRIEIVSVAVTFEYGGLQNPPTVEGTRDVKAALGSSWTYVVETNGTSVRDAYGIDRVPTFFLIGKDGTIAYIHLGGLNLTALRDAIDAALAR